MRFISVICVRCAEGPEGKAGVAQYTAKEALIDFGFIDGYFRVANFYFDDHQDLFWLVLDRLEEHVTRGLIGPEIPQPTAYARFLHDLGCLRGMLWTKPASSAVSEAFDRVIRFATGNDEFPVQLLNGGDTTQEPVEDQLSDEQRHQSAQAAEAGEGVHTPEYAAAIGASHRGVLEHWRRQGAWCQDEVEEEIKAAADAPKSPAEVDNGATESASPKAWNTLSDDQADIVRQMAESMTDDEIAADRGVSRDTVLRFRKKHGIEKSRGPREGKTRWEYQWEPWQKQKLIEMKQAGASYSEIGTAIGKTPSQCSGMWFWEKKKLEVADAEIPKTSVEPEPTKPANATVSAVIVSPAARWTPSPLNADDWPDIQRMLADGRSRETIAYDYDVPTDMLNTFIAERLAETRERHAAKGSPPGESSASVPTLTDSAA